MNRETPLPSPDWRQHLATLPEIDPSDALWLRLQRAYSPEARASRRWPWLGVAAAAVLAAVLVWPRAPAPAPAVLDSGPLAMAATRSDPGLRRLDDELALAYARNADESEIAALWQTRERLIASPQDSAPALLARL